jgi:RNA polymerase sigma-70 factor (ECF subfamily)
MASAPGDRVELLAVNLERQAVSDWSAADTRHGTRHDANEDARLVKAACRGDRTAFGLLYDRYAPMVHGILLARVPLGEVDGLVQEVFLQALPRLHTLRNITRFGAWLAAITRNRANDYHRRAVEEVELTDDMQQNEGEGRAAGSSYGTEVASILSAIRSLPEAYRETLLLRLVEGMTGPEIAARTGLTHGSVRVNLSRGMEQLRDKLPQISPASPQTRQKGTAP